MSYRVEGKYQITSSIIYSRSIMVGYIVFLSCLEFAVLNSLYQDTILKSKQVICLENIYLKDVMCVLPMLYGKSLIFHLLLMLLYAKRRRSGNRALIINV